MRTVASIALLLLLLALAADMLTHTEHALAKREQRDEQRASHTLRIFSSGWRLPPAMLGSNKRLRGIFVDDEPYTVNGNASGLRVLRLPPDDKPIEIVNFDLGASDADVNRFATLLAETPLDTVLALSIFRTASPRGVSEPARRAKIGMLLRGLGVRSAPEAAPVSSLAFVCIRRPQGFVPLAESFSTTRGVSLAFHLNKDLSVYDDHVPTTTLDHRRTVELAPTAAVGENHTVDANRRLSEVGFPALRVSSTDLNAAHVSWKLDPNADPKAYPNLSLGELTPVTFFANIGLHWNGSETLQSVHFTLRVNGREMGRRAILRDGGEQMRWLAWEQRLAPDIGPIESLEIDVVRIGSKGPAAITYIANVALRSGRVASL